MNDLTNINEIKGNKRGESSEELEYSQLPPAKYMIDKKKKGKKKSAPGRKKTGPCMACIVSSVCWELTRSRGAYESVIHRPWTFRH